MSDARTGTLLLRAAGRLDRPPPAADAALVGRLAGDRDPAAFAELVARHGPAVWAVCRRLTRSEPDADDVFQATFLVLARHPGRVRKAGSVGSWLHGVAARLGRKARALQDRRPDPHRLTPRTPPPDPAAGPSWDEVRAALDEELAALPDRLRAPLLLCYLDGRTQDEAATALGLNPRTVKARIARGRELLRGRLTRRGVGLPAALAVPLLAPRWAPAVPDRLTSALTTAFDHLTRRRPPGVSAAAVALARSEAPPMTLVRMVLLTATAAGLAAAGSSGRVAGPPAAAVAEPPPPAAVARIGTTQFRQTGWHHRAFFTADGKTLVAPTERGVVNLWEADTGRLLGTIPLTKFGPRGADFHPASGTLALFGPRWPDDPAADATYQVAVVDVAARRVARMILMADPPNTTNYHRIAFTPDGTRLVGGTDGHLRVWDVATGEEKARQKVKTGLSAFALSRDGKTAAFGDRDLFLWDWEGGGEPQRLATIAGGPWAEPVAFGPDGQTLYVGSFARHVTVYDRAAGRVTARLDVGSGPGGLAFSPDGKTLAVGYHGRRSSTAGEAVALFDPATGREVKRLPTGRAAAGWVAWSPDGTRVAGVTDYRVWAWDAATGRPLAPSAPGHEGHISDFAFAPDGRLFTASDDGSVRSWDAATGAPGLTLDQASWVRGVDVSPDGGLVAGSALENDLRVWDARTGAERFKLLGNGPSGGRRMVRFTADGKTLVAWGDDKFVRAFDVRTGKLLTEHSTRPPGTEPDPDDRPGSLRELDALETADLTADGSLLVIGSFQGVRVVEAATGKEVPVPFAVPLPPVPEAAAVSPDGKLLAVAARAPHTEAKQANGLPRQVFADEHPLLVYERATGKLVWRASAAGTSPGRLRFSPDGARLGVLAGRGEDAPHLRVWEAATGKDLGRVEVPGAAWTFAFDRTGRKLAVSHIDTTAAVYDLEKALKQK